MKKEYEIPKLEIMKFDGMGIYTTIDVIGGSGNPEDDIFGGEY